MPDATGYDIIIMHGTLGSPDGNWFPWLRGECEAKGHTVFVPTFPTPEKQSRENWCRALREQAPIFNENTILIGHSLGATLMMHILEMMTKPVHQSIFVAPVLDEIGNSEYDDLNRTFIKKMLNFDWLTMSNNMGDCHIFHSDNDPFVPSWHAQCLQDQIGGELHVIKGGGHLNAESGYTAFPEILGVLGLKGENLKHGQ